jgi:ATP-dependent DNA helicase RecQ
VSRPVQPQTPEQAEAQLALQGIEEVEAQLEPRPTRVYDGPRDPRSLLAHLGHRSFRPGQLEAVEAALSGRDSLVVMPTGGGKSLCYQLPALASEDLTIVVSPLIALMADQWQRLTAAGHPAVMLASGLPDDVMRDATRQVRDGTARIVYCSPERFGSSASWDALGSRRVGLFAVDEAHCLAEWGHDFRPDYLRLPRAAERLGRPAVMACTATATEEVAAEISRRMDLRDPVLVRSGFDRPNLTFDIATLEGKGSKARKLYMLERGLRDEGVRPAIVYCGTRKDTDELAATLARAGFGAVGYHAGMPPDERASGQHRFMSGDADVIVATNAFGMGVDKADVRSVWHWAIPTSVEAYYQEAGRAGRDGAPARALLLAGRADLSRLVHFNERREIEPREVAAYIERLGADAGVEGELVIESPRADAERIRLAIAERAGGLSVEPAPGGRLRIELDGPPGLAALARECRVASDRGWRAFRAVKAFAFSDTCRRQALLAHFGDRTPPAPIGRCCDVCDPEGGLPDPETIPARPARRPSAGPEPVDLSPEDESLFLALREWRMRAADGKPAYTVAHDSTLREIAARRPRTRGELERIRGIGPSFMGRHAPALLELLAERGRPDGPGPA